ncbi:MAG TPA: cytochrome c-type biogenesis protein CcmH [Limnochorda sp.]
MTRKAAWLLALVLVAATGLWAYVELRGALGNSIRVGDRLPAVPLPMWDGGTWDLAGSAGRPVLLRVSSRACATCANDFALLDAIQSRYGSRLKVVAVEVQSTQADVERALQGLKPSYPIALDPDGRVMATWPVKGLPTLVVLDRTGRFHAAYHGEVRTADLDALVGGLLPTPLEPGSAEFQDQFRRVALQIRCQECEGLSVWESDATSAWIARAEIQERLLQGWTPGEIVRWFEDRYGIWILMSPPARGGLSWAWLTPMLALLAGLGLTWRYLRRQAREAPQDPDIPAAEPLPVEVERRLKEYL